MRLGGSCQCGKVRFTVESETPYPFMYCYCSICRKTEGAFGCNVMGRRATLRVTGRRHLRRHHPVMREKGKRPYRSEGERCFCAACGTHLFVLDRRWPEGVWPSRRRDRHAAPTPPEQVHMMLRYKRGGCRSRGGGGAIPSTRSCRSRSGTRGTA